ncbi:MAG: hypothetical protein HKO66_09615 [Saprospiraceae bacterium]|nr:hypothetical protein [Bacteroidia bacterium]NNL92476.1 hypothetical protein [Saprospiraceae bacterium]
MNAQVKAYSLLKNSLFLILFLISFSLINCRNNPPKPKPQPEPVVKPVKALDKLFSAAMADAQNPEPSEVYDSLTTIEGNEDLIDSVINGNRHVLMVSWKNHPENYPEKGIYNTSKWNIWVTAAPYIQQRCKDYFQNSKDPILRLRQLLGLQPFTEETIFLQLWVKPEDLFRPCPDSETSDTKCNLSLPADVSEEYRKWFNDLRAVQYRDCTDTLYHELGYPWTQLGYTYDWSDENESNIGLSEFVVKKNAIVYVEAETPTSEYCKN